MNSLSPLKLTFLVTTASVITRILIYSVSATIFAPSALTIRFSSGMIIVFCYCAIFTRFERKKSPLVPIIVRCSTWSVIRCIKTTSLSERRMQIRKFLHTPIICLAIGAILIAIVGINKNIFSPSKSLLPSY